MLIVGIAGGTGSGKTTVVRKIIEKLPEGEVAVIPQDSYYYDSSHIPMQERQKINFDHPDSIEFGLLIDHVRQLREGRSIAQPVYSYLTCTRQAETVTVNPHDVIIIEGILVLTNKELRDMMDLKVFVDAEADDRLIRVIMRDIVERGHRRESPEPIRRDAQADAHPVHRAHQALCRHHRAAGRQQRHRHRHPDKPHP